MQLLRVHHVAFAHAPGSPLLGAAGDLLGLRCAHEEVADGFTERMLPVGDGFLQLLEAHGADGVVGRFVDRRGAGLHHVAFEVDDVRDAVHELRAAGVEVLEPAPRPGGMGTTIAFVHPSAFGGLLVELVEVATVPDTQAAPDVRSTDESPSVADVLTRWCVQRR